MFINHNHINISFNINIKNNEFIKYYLINLYNKVNIFKIKWDINYDYCENSSYERVKYYIKKYEYNSKNKNKIISLYKNKENKIKIIENEKNKEYNINFLNKNEKKTQIFIADIKQSSNFSLINMISTLFLLTPKYGYVLFFLKIYIDYKINNIDILRIKLLKYLESKSIISIDYI